jgi:hypothetical protein
MAALSHDARDGLMRAWLAILAERHPEVVWVPAEPSGEPKQHRETGEAGTGDRATLA